MTKNELLKKVHKLVWENDDMIDQDTLFDLQELIDTELVLEHNKGNLVLEQLGNGYIKKINLKKGGNNE